MLHLLLIRALRGCALVRCLCRWCLIDRLVLAIGATLGPASMCRLACLQWLTSIVLVRLVSLKVSLRLAIALFHVADPRFCRDRKINAWHSNKGVGWRWLVHGV